MGGSKKKERGLGIAMEFSKKEGAGQKTKSTAKTTK